MSILINKDTKVVTQGITGKTGQFHTRTSRAYANGQAAFVAGVHPTKAGENFEGIPIFASVKEAKAETGVNVSVIYVPPAGAAAAIWEGIEAELDLVICITEGIPVRDLLDIKDRMARMKSKTLLLGPNCPGLITPDEIKIGIMPGHIHRKGRIGIVSRSGTLTYEAVAQVTELGLGQSSAVGIGGDPINGMKHIDVLKLFNEDPETDAVIMIGEIGGPDEVNAALWAKENMKKPVVAYIAGLSAPKGRRMGHAGAIVGGADDTAEAKKRILRECGLAVADSPADMAQALLTVYQK
jgi:succinyl-CoA synthetase alpha subunit